MAVTLPSDPITARLESLLDRARTLESEGVPYPTSQIRDAVEMALAEGDAEKAASVLKGAETLYSKAARDWTWVRELLARADELRELAESVGMDLTVLESRVGKPREQLRSAPLSAGSLERAAASASLALAILNDAIPKYCIQEAQKLGESIRRARDRGEDVTEVTGQFRRLLAAIQEDHLSISTKRLVETRHAVARIPSAPSVGPLPSIEEEEILREARTLARRLHRIRGKARDAKSAARLMSQVRAALSDDRRFGSPEEEIEGLWNEVDRLTKERALAGGLTPPEPDEEELPETEADVPEGATRGAAAATPAAAPPATPPPDAEGTDPANPRRAAGRLPPAVGIVPPVPLERDTETDPAAPVRRRGRDRAART